MGEIFYPMNYVPCVDANDALYQMAKFLIFNFLQCKGSWVGEFLAVHVYSLQLMNYIVSTQVMSMLSIFIGLFDSQW